jgi:hypothetical protein
MLQQSTQLEHWFAAPEMLGNQWGNSLQPTFDQMLRVPICAWLESALPQFGAFR